MKSLELNAYGVSEMSRQEMVETDGGLIPLLIVAAVLVVTACSCNNTVIINNGNDNQTTTTNKIDSVSTANGNTANVKVK